MKVFVEANFFDLFMMMSGLALTIYGYWVLKTKRIRIRIHDDEFWRGRVINLSIQGAMVAGISIMISGVVLFVSFLSVIMNLWDYHPVILCIIFVLWTFPFIAIRL